MTPIVVGTDVDALWVDLYQQVHLNDSRVLRGGNSRTMCVVIPEGLACYEAMEMTDALETEGAERFSEGWLFARSNDDVQIVDGSAGDWVSVCWLTSAGEVWCRELPYDMPEEQTPELVRYFSDVDSLALGINYYSPGRDRCAVATDGSLWCIGSNYAGKFGTGDTEPLAIETRVAPPGSVRIDCKDSEAAGATRP